MTMYTDRLGLEMRKSQEEITRTVNEELSRLRGLGVVVEEMSFDFVTEHKVPGNTPITSVLVHVGMTAYEEGGKLRVEI